MRYISHMYVYSASDSTCCMFPSSLKGRTLAWYVYLPPRSIKSLRDLGKSLFKTSFPNLFFDRHPISYWASASARTKWCVISWPGSTKQPKKLPLYPKNIQGYRYGLTNQAFFQKLAEQEPIIVSGLLQRMEQFSQADNYVCQKWDIDNEVKEVQNTKRPRNLDH